MVFGIKIQLANRHSDRGSHGLCALARLKEGVSPGAADAGVRGDLRAQGATLDGLRQQTLGINRGLEMLNRHLLEKG